MGWLFVQKAKPYDGRAIWDGFGWKGLLRLVFLIRGANAEYALLLLGVVVAIKIGAC
jgi:hypothetical protein